jgi:nucleotide-binding universal stress UspA family protein
MFTHVLVPLDGSAFSEQAIAPARSLAEHYGARLTLLTVVLEFPASRLQVPLLDQGSEDRGRLYLEEVRATHMGAAGVPVDLVVKRGMPAESIAEVARRRPRRPHRHEHARHDWDAIHSWQHRMETPAGRALSRAAHGRASPHGDGIAPQLDTP